MDSIVDDVFPIMQHFQAWVRAQRALLIVAFRGFWMCRAKGVLVLVLSAREPRALLLCVNCVLADVIHFRHSLCQVVVPLFPARVLVSWVHSGKKSQQHGRNTF